MNTQSKMIYSPSEKATPTPGTLYSRVIELKHSSTSNGSLLVTFEQYSFDTPVFPIYRSMDQGESWTLHSNVSDTKNNWGMRYQPFLYELPQSVGDLPAGTILCAGNSIPSDMSSTELLLFKSLDGGLTWSYMSTIVAGGRAIYDPKGPDTPVWEPFLALDKFGRLVCYYSDEGFKDQNFHQLLVHKVSNDGGLTWGDPVIDVAIPDGVTRPGMPIVAKLPDDTYIMVLEVVGLPNVPVYYKRSADGLDWGDPYDLGTPIQDENGYFPSGTPYIIWTPYGGGNGMLIVSGRMSCSPNGELQSCDFLVNYQLGAGAWHRVTSPLAYNTNNFSGYSRSMTPLSDQQSLIHVSNVEISETHAEIRAVVLSLASFLEGVVDGDMDSTKND
jgi:hypothetical protein